jgi:hypothetical protein
MSYVLKTSVGILSRECVIEEMEDKMAWGQGRRSEQQTTQEGIDGGPDYGGASMDLEGQ